MVLHHSTTGFFARLFTFRLPMLLAVGAILPTGAEGQLMADSEEVATHLEFLGYEVTESDTNLTAKHETKLDVLLQNYQGGTLLQSFLGVENHEDEALPMANLLNTGAAVARFYVDGDGDLAIEAWMPGNYDKGRFATFLVAWDADTVGQIRTHSEEIMRLFN